MSHVEIGTEDLGGYELTSGYYTIRNNIDNPECVFYVDDHPAKEDYFNFARGIASYFFIVHKGDQPLVQIVVMPKKEGMETKYYYNVQNPSNGQTVNIESTVSGDIAQYRAEELVGLHVDPEIMMMELPDGERGLQFEGIVYHIQPYADLKGEVVELVKKLLSPTLQPMEHPEAFIKAETIGGKLDFNKVLEKEDQQFFLYDDVAYNKKDFAIFLWGQTVHQLGVSSVTNAVSLWEEIYGRKLTAPEEVALKKGFASKSK